MHAINMHQRFLTTFFFLPEAKEYISHQQQDMGKWMYDCGWLRFHACVGVLLYFRTHFHRGWHTRQSSEICLSNPNLLYQITHAQAEKGDGDLE